MAEHYQFDAVRKEIIRALRWRSRQRVVVGLDGDAIVIRDYKPRQQRQN